MKPGTTQILTPDQRLRVFVSSALQELSLERTAARAAIEALRLIPVMFELGARPHPARALYRAYLEQSHVFVGVYFERYGWVAPGEEVSGLEDEYRLSGGLPRLVYFKSPAPNRDANLDNLANRIRDDDTVAYKSFASPEELESLLREDLAVLLSERFLAPTAPQVNSDLLPSAVAPAWTPIPTPLSSLIGRETEIARIEALMSSEVRLLTIVGPGGIGKTRLGIETARRLSPRFAGAASFVGLEAVEDPAGVLLQIAASIGLGVDGSVEPIDALAAAFGDRPVLLLIDNFEQVHAAAPDVSALLARCPNVVAIVTSRVPLKVRGEQLFPLGPLQLPASDDTTWDASAAVRLFVERAAAIRPDFRPDQAGEADAVAELCQRLDGIPLALELAAGRTAVLAPHALLDRIGTALDLATGTADLPARQRTLRDTLAWSQHLLSPSQASLLARLSMFVAPWTLADAEAVADPLHASVIDDLAGLVENNLVAPAPNAPGEPRFRLFMTVRAYADELLDQATRESVESAYIAWLSQQAGTLYRKICSPEGRRWQAEFRLMWPDLRRAWQLALDREDAENTALSALSLLPLWLEGSARQGFDLIQPSLELALRGQPHRHGDLQFVCCQAAYTLGDYELAGRLLDGIGTDVPVPTDPMLAGAAILLRGYSVSNTRDWDTCERLLEQSLEGSDWYEAFARSGLGWVYAQRRDTDAAVRQFELARQVGRNTGNIGGEMQGFVFEADMRLLTDERDRARALLVAACDLVEALPYFEGNAYCLEAVAAFAAADDAAEAARLLGLASALREMTGARIWVLVEDSSARNHDLVRTALTPERFDAAFAEGGKLDPRTAGAHCRRALSTSA